MMNAQPVESTMAVENEKSTRAPRPYDSLRIIMRHVLEGDAGYYQATLQQRGAVGLGGPFRQRELFRADDVQALRSCYDRQLGLMHELAAAGVPVSAHALDTHELVVLGRRVAAVLPPTIRQGIVTALERARRRRRGLRLTLEVAADARQLLAIPWELMVLPLARGTQADAGGEGFVLLNADVTLVRQVQGIGCNTPPALTRPLKLQAFAATPADGISIDLEPTRSAIAQVLAPRPMEQFWYDGPDTLTQLQERLRTADPQVLHLLCHGEQSDTGHGIRSDLLLTHRDGYTQRVSAFDLAPLLTLAPDLQLVVLQACHAGAILPDPTGQAGANDRSEQERRAAESIALALVRQGVPTVVAMQGAVGQAAAGAFVRACYAALAQGECVERAVAAGRIAMRAAGGLVDWSLPVIYQGSGVPELETWYTRLADRIDSALHDPATRRALRGGIVALALVLLTAGVLRWLLLLPPDSPRLDVLVSPLAAWASLGIVGPAIIAAAHRGVRERNDLDAAVRHAALLAQWQGAYLGYVLGGLLGLGVLASLWFVGLLERIPPPGPLLLFGSVLLGALLLSYAAARSQVRSALAIAPFAPGLYDRRTFGLIMLATLLLLMAPFGLFLLPGTPFAFLLNPAAGAVAMGTALISMVLRFRA